MKIIQLTYSLGSGGAERVVVDLANEMFRRGHEVIVCAILDLRLDERFSFNISNLLSGVRYVNLEQNYGFHFSKLKAVEHFINTEKPDVVHCHLNNIPYIFRLALKNKNIRFVHTLHNIAPEASGNRYQYPLNKYFYAKGLIKPVTISSICQKSYEQFYGLSNSTCIINGRSTLIPTDKYSSVKQEIHSLKNNKDSTVFIHVARLDNQKNQKLLIDSFNELYNQGRDFILLIIGFDFDSAKGKQLCEKACPFIHFLGVKNNVQDYLLNSDAFCLTSHYEGLPISLLEAMACGCIPICTPVGGIPDVVRHSVNGYLSQDLSITSYVSTLQFFLDYNKITRDTVINDFLQNYSIESTVNQYLEVYKK